MVKTLQFRYMIDLKKNLILIPTLKRINGLCIHHTYQYLYIRRYYSDFTVDEEGLYFIVKYIVGMFIFEMYFFKHVLRWKNIT